MMTEQLQKIEELLKKRVCVGSQVLTSRLVEELKGHYSEQAVGMAISNMVRNGEFKEIKGRKQLIREQ